MTETTIKLPLSQGYVAIIDIEDACQAVFKWTAAVRSNTVYAYRGRGPLLHRAIMGPLPRGAVVDHIDGNGLNCRRSNLRVVTQTINTRNKPEPTGVSRHGQNDTWTARIRAGGKNHYLGTFKNRDDAVTARREAEVRLWGIEPRRRAYHS